MKIMYTSLPIKYCEKGGANLLPLISNLLQVKLNGDDKSSWKQKIDQAVLDQRIEQEFRSSSRDTMRSVMLQMKKLLT